MGVSREDHPGCGGMGKTMSYHVVSESKLWLQQQLLFPWPPLPAHEMTTHLSSPAGAIGLGRSQGLHRDNSGLPQALGRRKYDTLPGSWASLPSLASFEIVSKSVKWEREQAAMLMLGSQLHCLLGDPRSSSWLISRMLLLKRIMITTSLVVYGVPYSLVLIFAPQSIF